jgi:hypothetical protein
MNTYKKVVGGRVDRIEQPMIGVVERQKGLGIRPFFAAKKSRVGMIRKFWEEIG